MKLISWNVNGLRACLQKGFVESVAALDADVIALQETKLQAGQLEMKLPGYESYWHYAQHKGYSGTAVFTRIPPRSVQYGIGAEEYDAEGRTVILEFDGFWLVNVYVPNAQRELVRIGFRLAWEAALLKKLKELEKSKPVILCGDLNVAHEEIDLKNPKSNRGSAGFSDEERAAFSNLLAQGFVDTFRYFYPDRTGAYSWWSYMFHARENNAGWRIDYFVVSQVLCSRLRGAQIHPQIMGSDHCPVELTLDGSDGV